MPKFRAFIKGEGLLIHTEESPRVVPSGFYVTAFVEAASSQTAESTALALVRESHVYSAAANRSEVPPRITVEELEEIADWPVDTQRPLTGFALFEESEAAL